MVRGFGYKQHKFDTMRCMNLFYEQDKSMTDFTPDEDAAMRRGGAAGAEYLVSINQFSLDKLNPDQAMTFLRSVIGTYHEALVATEAVKYP